MRGAPWRPSWTRASCATWACATSAQRGQPAGRLACSDVQCAARGSHALLCNYFQMVPSSSSRSVATYGRRRQCTGGSASGVSGRFRWSERFFRRRDSDTCQHGAWDVECRVYTATVPMKHSSRSVHPERRAWASCRYSVLAMKELNLESNLAQVLSTYGASRVYPPIWPLLWRRVRSHGTSRMADSAPTVRVRSVHVCNRFSVRTA